MLEQDELLRFARAGAEARLRELEREMESILTSFPDLRPGHGGEAPAAGVGKRPPRQLWNAEQRKAISERMRRYWANRREAEKRQSASAAGSRPGRSRNRTLKAAAR